MIKKLKLNKLEKKINIQKKGLILLLKKKKLFKEQSMTSIQGKVMNTLI